MITISQIKSPNGYLKHYMSAVGDYYDEGEKDPRYWCGEGAKMLGLSGEVEQNHLESLGQNKHPFSGEKLTPRKPKTAFHDITYSAPKSLSILALVAGDERLIQAFYESTEFVIKELEKYASVRVRTGEKVNTESIRTTSNLTVAVIQHDSNRTLCPQLHAHMLTANISYDSERESWYALQPRQMMEASPRLRESINQDLAKRVEALGYTVDISGNKFRIDGISDELEEKFSLRSQHRKAFETRYRELFGVESSKERVEAFIKDNQKTATQRFKNEFESKFGRLPTDSEVKLHVKDWRSQKLKNISKKAIAEQQRSRLTAKKLDHMMKLVYQAKQRVQQAEKNSSESDSSYKTEEKVRRREEFSREGFGVRQNRKREEAREKSSQTAQNADVTKVSARQEALRQVKKGLRVAASMKGHQIRPKVRRHRPRF